MCVDMIRETFQECETPGKMFHETRNMYTRCLLSQPSGVKRSCTECRLFIPSRLKFRYTFVTVKYVSLTYIFPVATRNT